MLMSAGTCRGILSEISVITQEEREGALLLLHCSRLLSETVVMNS
jgi:hypothetical protein